MTTLMWLTSAWIYFLEDEQETLWSDCYTAAALVGSFLSLYHHAAEKREVECASSLLAHKLSCFVGFFLPPAPTIVKNHQANLNMEQTAAHPCHDTWLWTVLGSGLTIPGSLSGSVPTTMVGPIQAAPSPCFKHNEPCI